MGNFAQQSLPLVDEVTLTVQRVGSNAPETFTVRMQIHGAIYVLVMKLAWS